MEKMERIERKESIEREKGYKRQSGNFLCNVMAINPPPVIGAPMASGTLEIDS